MMKINKLSNLLALSALLLLLPSCDDGNKPDTPVTPPVATVKDGVLVAFPDELVKDGTVTLGEDVKGIRESLFANKPGIKKVTAPGVIKLGNAVFSGSSNLENVEMPKLEEIGDNAFAKTAALGSVNFPEVKKIGNHAFSETGSLVSVGLPKVEEIGNSAFAGASKLATVELGVTRPKMGEENPFKDTPENKDLKIVGDEGLYDHYDYEVWAAGYGFKKFNGEEIKAIPAPEGFEAEGRKITKMTDRNKGFQYSVTLHEYFNEIGDEVFSWPRRATYEFAKIIAPGVTKVGNRCFKDCPNLRIVEMPKLKKIGEKAFSGNSYQLTYMDKTQALEVIGKSAFEYCKYLELIVAPNLKKIGADAFKGCDRMKTWGVLVLGVTPPELEGGLGIDSISELVVPASAKEAYEKWEHIGKFSEVTYDDARYNEYIQPQ